MTKIKNFKNNTENVLYKFSKKHPTIAFILFFISFPAVCISAVAGTASIIVLPWALIAGLI